MSGSPVEKIVRKILRDNEKQRRDISKKEQFALRVFCPDRANPKNNQAAESSKRKPGHDRMPEMQNTKVDCAEKQRRNEYQGSVEPAASQAQMHDDDAGK